MRRTRAQYFQTLKQRNAKELKNSVDTAYELYTSLSEEERYAMNLTAFCSLLQSHMSLQNWKAAYHVTKHMQLEYYVEFAKTCRSTSRGFTGHKHTAESRQKMSINTSINQLGKKRGPYRKTVEKNLACINDNLHNNTSHINTICSQIVV